jgi:Flp pilus assembly pilin Flp
MKSPTKRTQCSTTITSIAADQRGLSAVEYVIILVLIAASAVGIWGAFGKTIVGKIIESNTRIEEIDPGNSNGAK